MSARTQALRKLNPEALAALNTGVSAAAKGKRILGLVRARKAALERRIRINRSNVRNYWGKP